MDTPHQKCRAMIVKLVETSLDDHYSGEGHKERCQGVFALDAFAHLQELPQAEQTNNFVASLMQKVARNIWAENKPLVMTLIQSELDKLIDELLTEQEADELYAFGISSTGQKVFRNLDLMKNAVAKGRNIMSAGVIRAWSDPSVNEEIDRFIQSLDDGNLET